MRVFWFDGEGTRDWRTLLSGFDIAAWGILTRPKVEPGDILVCHQAYLNGEALELAREAATAGVVVLAVSGVALDGAVCDGIYYRATPVDRPTDKSFSEAFCRFARALQASGAPDWRLIEPLDAPECLLSYYLLMCAGLDPICVPAPDGRPLLEAVREEYRLLLRQFAGQVDTLPSPDGTLALPELRAIVRALRADA